MGKKLKRLKNKKKKAKAKAKAKAEAASSARPTPPPPPPWLELPPEVTANILHRLGAHDMLKSAQEVCTTWRNVCKDPSIWRVIDMKNLGKYHDMSVYLETTCRQAVDRSEGQLTDIYIDYFATDELLQYISERSSQLRCLRLGGCYGVSGDGLSEAAKRFPLLEELHLVFVMSCNDGIEAIGRSCPKLRSFTLSESSYKHSQLPCNDDALAIAKSMPGLHHLQLLGNNMTNEGLQAILDGCLLLESLDIRRCFKVDLSGDLGKRITQKIKDSKHPYDSMEDCEWNTDIFDCVKSEENYYYSSEFSDWEYYDYDDYFNVYNSDGDNYFHDSNSDGYGFDPYFF
ncbi:F-box protein SKIP19-like [Olea europaea var. sylvestris]|uniref:F-box protein SKIP19-like n=1 Tax=Olea europaea var. sylvestris TaxID=158386 RepID=UPI000C1CD30E|nr:F-box protein SKIP19-like [Olea europaea var. sylvestris]XP_022863163.1 F-box protein SKIP19-like [Olea europaea var. sylvestris]